MPVLRSIRERFDKERPLDGVTRRRVPARHGGDGEPVLRLVAAAGRRWRSAPPTRSPPRTTSPPRAAAGVEVHAARGEASDAYAAHVRALAAGAPTSRSTTAPTCCSPVHEHAGGRPPIGGTEETTTGLLRLRRSRPRAGCPVLAVNESRTERTFNDRYGTGQSALDGILRATNLLLAGHTLVVLGYGFTGKGIAQRARGAGAAVIVCEVDPLRALEARMEGFEVMPALDAAERGDLFVTVTGSRRRAARRALRADEGRRRAGQRRPLRRRDRPRGPARARPGEAGARSCRWSSSTTSDGRR